MNPISEDGLLFDSNQDQEPQIIKTDNVDQLGRQFLKGQSLSNEFNQIDIVNKIDLSQDSIPEISSQSYKDTPRSHVRSKTQKDHIIKNQSILISSNSRSSKQGQQITNPNSQNKHLENIESVDRKHYGSQQSSLSVYSNLMRFFHTKQFVNRITRRKKMNHMFSSYHFNVLNDKGAVFNQKLFKDSMLQIKPLVQRNIAFQKQKTAFYDGVLNLKNKFFSVGQKISTYGQKLPIFYPETPTMLLWDFLVNISRIYFMIFLPLDLCFNKKDFLFEDWVSQLMLILLTCHVFVSFNTAYYEKGSIVSNRVAIIFHVFGKFAGLEIFTIISLLGLWIVKSFSNGSYQISIQMYPYQLLYLLFLLQYQNVASFFRQFQETFSFSRYVGSLLELFKLILGIIYVLHLFTCIWFWAGEDSLLNRQPSWLEKNGVDNSDWSVQYLYSIYYSTVTMFTVGYGDITPQSDVERMISILFMVFSSVQLSYSVNTVGTIINQISKNEEIKSKNLQIINSYMQNKKISYQLQYQQKKKKKLLLLRIREYLNYLWQSEKADTCMRETSIIEQLSISLRDKLKIEANKMMFNECILFKHFFSDQLKNYLIRKVIPVVVQPESIVDYSALVSNKDTQDKIFLCFIEEGQLDVIVENDANIYGYSAEVSTLQKKSEGETLGLVSFISGVKMTEKFRSNQFSKLLLLSRDDFIKTLMDFPEDQEVFYTIQEQLRYQKSSELVKKLNIQCSSCNSCQHREINCPLLHFIPDQEFIIKSLQYSYHQDRNQNKQQFIRMPQIKNQFFNALLDQRQIEEVAFDFQKDNSNYTQFYEMQERNSILGDSSLNQETIQNIQQLNLQKPSNIISTIDDRHSSPILRRLIVQKPLDVLPFGKKTNNSFKNNILNQEDKIIEQNEESMEQNLSLENSGPEEANLLNIEQLVNRDKRPNLADKIKQKFFFENQQIIESPKNLMLPPLKKISNSRTSNLEPQQDLELRFYKTIKTVQSINSLKKKIRGDKQINITQKKEKNFILQQSVSQNLQIKTISMYEALNNRIRLLQKYRHQFPSILLKAFDEGEFTLIKLEMILGDDKLQGRFETIKNYKFYFPENNIENVISRQKTYYDINKLLIGNLHEVYHRLLQYVSFPYVYIEKYKFTQIDQRMVLIPSNKRNAKLKQEFKPSKTQEKRMRQSSKRNINITRKVQQIRPQSEQVRSVLSIVE